MTYSIKKAAVIGSGTMGGGIAALLAGIGVDVTLLDIPAKDTQPGDPAPKRNAIVANNLKTLQKMRPAQLFSEVDMANIKIGNIDDDLANIGDADWIIEVIVERLDIKQSLMAKLAEVIHPHTIVTSNTSGLPIHKISEHLDDSFKRRFLGTHFFNPPRYLKLLEVIPTPHTDPEIVAFMQEFGTNALGKGVVICKDTPNFIGNRFMSMSGMQAMNYAIDHNYTVEEVDALTGPLIGRPKTATFNLNDLVGFDIAVGVARNLYHAIPDDPSREMLNNPKAQALSDELLKRNWIGRKSGQGFYLMKKSASGEKEFWALNLNTLEYEAPKTVEFESVKKHQKVKPTGERIRMLLGESDRGAEYLFHLHGFYLAYASQKVGEITESLYNIDNAQKWGFAHEMGPFEIWDAIGVAEYAKKFEEAGYQIATWVGDMLNAGHTQFYKRNDGGYPIAYYSPQEKRYIDIPKDPMLISIAELRSRASETILAENSDGAVYNIGDGVLLWEFRSKQNTITAKFVEMGYKALELLNQTEYIALVVANDSDRFSIGANLQDAMMGGVEGIEKAIKALQDLTVALKYAAKPVITAPSGMALGGGAEMVMAGHATVAHAESYMGLVEVGVGLIPAGGGCKELVRRLVNPVAASGSDILAPLQKVFEAIATAKTSESAAQARDNGFISSSDKIVTSRERLIGEAKAFAIASSASYVQRKPEKVYAAGRDAYAALNIGIAGFLESGFASEHDAFIARKLAFILTGGALAQPQWVDQEVFLALERQAFMELAMHPKSQERVMYMLQNNKPLRN
jgi:3-hydroxyacyl-CoA dehydrogenase